MEARMEPSFKEYSKNEELLKESLFKNRLPSKGDFPYVPPVGHSIANPKQVNATNQPDVYQDARGWIWTADRLHKNRWEVRKAQEKNPHRYVRVSFDNGRILEAMDDDIIGELLVEKGLDYFDRSLF